MIPVWQHTVATAAGTSGEIVSRAAAIRRIRLCSSLCTPLCVIPADRADSSAKYLFSTEDATASPSSCNPAPPPAPLSEGPAGSICDEGAPRVRAPPPEPPTPRPMLLLEARVANIAWRLQRSDERSVGNEHSTAHRVSDSAQRCATIERLCVTLCEPLSRCAPAASVRSQRWQSDSR